MDKKNPKSKATKSAKNLAAKAVGKNEANVVRGGAPTRDVSTGLATGRRSH